MLETDLFARLKPRIGLWGTYSRVENSVEQGTWDTFYCIQGQAGWIETKVAKNGFLYFEKFQPNWARRYLRHGLNNLFVIAATDSKLMNVYHASDIVNSELEVYGKWQRIKVSELKPLLHMVPRYDWESLRLLLSEPFTFHK